MTQFVHIEAGRWVLSFHQPYGLHDDMTMVERLEEYAFRHWMDSGKVEDEFFVMRVQKVMPKTFTVSGSCRFISSGDRLPRCNVIAALKTEAAAIALRDKLFAIGGEVGGRIEKEMYRRIEKFSEREQAKGLKRVHSCLPHIFRSGS